jgi:hypothetical protein
MPRRGVVERVAGELQRCQERAADLRLRTAQAQARAQLEQNRERTANRKATEHRKFVAGGALLAAVQAGLVSEDQVRVWVDRWATRDKDRAAFGLPPLKNGRGG